MPSTDNYVVSKNLFSKIKNKHYIDHLVWYGYKLDKTQNDSRIYLFIWIPTRKNNEIKCNDVEN